MNHLPKIAPREIAFDVDGVVAETMRLFLEVAARDYGFKDIAYEDITTYELTDCLAMPRTVIFEIISKVIAGDYAHPLQMMEGAAAVIRKLADVAAPVLFVTARPRLGPLTEWFEEKLGLAPQQLDLVATGDFDAKFSVLNEKGKTHFVEDRLETCELLAASGLIPIVFVQPWNRRPHPYKEVSNWEELADFIDF